MKFKVKELFEILEKNRDGHRAVFESALEEFKIQAIKAFEQRIDRIKQGDKINLWVDLEEPKDHTQEYDVVLKMLALTIDQEIELNDRQFRQFVMDEWDWKNDFIRTASNYTKVS